QALYLSLACLEFLFYKESTILQKNSILHTETKGLNLLRQLCLFLKPVLYFTSLKDKKNGLLSHNTVLFHFSIISYGGISNLLLIFKKRIYIYYFIQ
ncbi:hypothetical protein SPOG_05016, partial [Schizosaccharomyces cryophilus OY26]